MIYLCDCSYQVEFHGLGLVCLVTVVPATWLGLRRAGGYLGLGWAFGTCSSHPIMCRCHIVMCVFSWEEVPGISLVLKVLSPL